MTVNNKVVYLTYDDGPVEDFRDKIDFLDSHNIKAVWFCQGNRLEADLDAAVYAIERGHIIANHSYDHPHFSGLTLEMAREQIQSTEKLIEQAYERACVKQPFKCFRFPYLDLGAGPETYPPDLTDKKTMMLQHMLRDMGFVCPEFEGINYSWYETYGFADTVSVEGTLNLDDWRINDDAEDIEAVYQDVLDRLDRDEPEKGLGLNTSGSNELVVLHAFVKMPYFKGIVEKMIEKGVKFGLPTTEQ